MKKGLITVVQILVTAAILYWIFHDPVTRAKMMDALRRADFRWIVLSAGVFVVVELLAGVRWWILLKVQKIHLSASRVSGLFFIGLFFNQFLPGGTGGDIMKSYLLLKETPGRATGALLAVLFDRMIGLIALVTLTGTLIGLRYDFLAQTPATRALLWPVLIILGISIAALLISFVVTGFNLLHRLPPRFPLREKLIEISAAYHLYARHWPATALAFVLSLAAHLGLFVTFLFVAFAFGAFVPVVDFFAVMPLERTYSSLPISFAGVGVREKVLQVMLHNLCAIPEAVAVLIGSMSFLVILFCCLPGGLVYLFYRPSGPPVDASLTEMGRTVAAVEHAISEEQT
jgi:uncharacterized protein (TIRG00374 family)